MTTGPPTLHDVHLNFLTAGSLANLILDPDRIKKSYPSSFLEGKEGYAAHYYDLFMRLYEFRLARQKGVAVNEPRLPYIRGLGSLMPLAGNEIANCPPYAGWHSDAHRLASFGILPYKIYPNWKVSLDANVAAKTKLSVFRCQPLLKLYSFGAVSYQIRFRLKSRNGIDLDTFINLMKSLSEEDILQVKKEKYSVSGLVSAFHRRIFEFLFGEESNERFEFHRVITINEASPELDPDNNQRELAALVTMDRRWRSKNVSFVQKHRGERIEGEYTHQFLLFHPQCAILYPAKIEEEPENDFFRTCLRNNITSVLEFAKVEKPLVLDVIHNLHDMPVASDWSWEQVQKRMELTVRVRDRLKHFDTQAAEYWGLMLFGIHEELYWKARSFESWKPLGESLLSELDNSERGMAALDLQEISLVQQIAKSAGDAADALDALKEKAEPFGMDKAKFDRFATQGRKLQSSLTDSVEQLNIIYQNAGTRYERPTDTMNRITYHDSIIADIGTYQKEFLPAYQQLVVPMVKDAVTKQAATQQETKPGPAPPTPVPTGGADQPQARASTSPTPPPSSNADLEKANQLVDEAVVLGSKLGFTNSIKEFYNNHKPYVDALVGAGKFLARFLGVPIP